MSTRKFVMPRTPVIGKAEKDGKVTLNTGYHSYLGGLEDVSGRVAANLASTATTAELIAALKTAGLMMPDS